MVRPRDAVHATREAPGRVRECGVSNQARRVNSSVIAIRLVLHDAVCQSSCQGNSRVEHARLQENAAKRISRTPTVTRQAELVHAVICDAELDSTFSGCPEHDRHMAWIASCLPWADSPSPGEGQLGMFDGIGA